MNLNEYQQNALSFRLPTASPAYALINLGGEVGELYSLLAKAERDGAKPDLQVNVGKELGDILWHVAAIANDFGFGLEEIAEGNIDKLSSRKANNTIQGSGDDR